MRDRTLLYVTFAHPSGGGTGVHRALKLARHLEASGWRVVLLSSPPQGAAPQDRAFPFRVVTGRSPLPWGATGAPPSQAPAVPAPEARPSRLRAFLREALFFPDPQLYWAPFGFTAAVRALRRGAVSAVLGSGPPFSVFLLARLLAAYFKVPLALDYRDVWLGHPWWPLPAWRQRADGWLERRLQSRARLIVANHERMRESLVAGHPGIADRCLVLPNGFDPGELGAPVRPRWRPGERFEIVYCGTLYGPVEGRGAPGEGLSVQRPRAFFEAVGRLRDQGAFGAGGVRVTFVGARPWTREAATLNACARECGVAGEVVVLPRMEKAETVPITRRAHLLLNILYYTEAQVAQKIYDYLHLEIPVLSLLRETPPNEELVRGAGAGPVVDPADAEAIGAAIEEILKAYARGETMGSGRRGFIDRFDVRRQARLLADSLEALVTGAARGAPAP